MTSPPQVGELPATSEVAPQLRGGYQSSSLSESSSSSRESCERGSFLLSSPRNGFPSTSSWDINYLESLGIYYERDYSPSPLDILDKIYSKRRIFRQLDGGQQKYVDYIKGNMHFNSSYQELMDTKTNQEKLQDILSEKLLPEMKTDLENFRSQTGISGVHTVAEDFIFSARQVILYESTYLRDMEYRSEQGPASEDMYVDMIRSFARMCRLCVGYGSAWRGKMMIQNVTVSSKADLVFMPLDFYNEPLGHLPSQKPSIVTVVECKNLQQHRSESSSAGEPESHSQPAIYQKVRTEALAQHGGQLLLYYRLYDEKLVDNTKDLQYFPGILIIGTEVIFTLLEIGNKHLCDLKTTDPIREKAKIYYSKPKDLLNKEDRDILIESFVRFNNM